MLSATKHLQYPLDNKPKQILRFAQDDSTGAFFRSLFIPAEAPTSMRGYSKTGRIAVFGANTRQPARWKSSKYVVLKQASRAGGKGYEGHAGGG